MLRDTLATKAFTARTLIDCGVLRPERPDRTGRALLALKRWGATPAAGYTAAAIRFPDATAMPVAAAHDAAHVSPAGSGGLFDAEAPDELPASGRVPRAA